MIRLVCSLTVATLALAPACKRDSDPEETQKVIDETKEDVAQTRVDIEEKQEEVIEDQASGFLVRPYDIRELQRRVDQILADDNLHFRLSKRARVVCTDRFAGAVMVENTQAFYEDLARLGN